MILQTNWIAYVWHFYLSSWFVSFAEDHKMPCRKWKTIWNPKFLTHILQIWWWKKTTAIEFFLTCTDKMLCAHTKLSGCCISGMLWTSNWCTLLHSRATAGRVRGHGGADGHLSSISRSDACTTRISGTCSIQCPSCRLHVDDTEYIPNKKIGW